MIYIRSIQNPCTNLLSIFIMISLSQRQISTISDENMPFYILSQCVKPLKMNLEHTLAVLIKHVYFNL